MLHLGHYSRRLKMPVQAAWVALSLVVAPPAGAAPVVPQKGSLAGYVYIPAPAAAPNTGGGGGGGGGDTAQLNTCYLDFAQTYPDITYTYPASAAQTSVVLHYTVVGGGGGAGGGNRLRTASAAPDTVQVGGAGKAGARNTGSFTFAAGDVLRLIIGGGGGAGTAGGFPAAVDGWLYGAGGSGAAGYYGGGGGGGGMSWGRFSDNTQPYTNNRGSGGGGGGSSAILKNGVPVAIGAGGDGGDGANWPNSGGKGGSSTGGAGAFNGAVVPYTTNGATYSYGGTAGALGAGGRGGAYGYNQLAGPAGLGVGLESGNYYDGYFITNNYGYNAANSGGGGGYGSAGGTTYSAFWQIPRGIANGGAITNGIAYPPMFNYTTGVVTGGFPVLMEENSRSIAQWLGRGRSSVFMYGYDIMYNEPFFMNSKVINGSAPWAGMGGRSANETMQYGYYQNSTTTFKYSLSGLIGWGGSSGAIMLSYQAKSCFL